MIDTRKMVENSFQHEVAFPTVTTCVDELPLKSQLAVPVPGRPCRCPCCYHDSGTKYTGGREESVDPGGTSLPHDHMVLGDVNLILQVQIEEQIVEARIPRHLDISRHQSLQKLNETVKQFEVSDCLWMMTMDLRIFFTSHESQW